MRAIPKVRVIKAGGYALPFEGTLRDFLYREDMGRGERAHFCAALRYGQGRAPHLGSMVVVEVQS